MQPERSLLKRPSLKRVPLQTHTKHPRHCATARRMRLGVATSPVSVLHWRPSLMICYMGPLTYPKTPKLGTSWASNPELSIQQEISQVETRKNGGKSDTTHQQTWFLSCHLQQRKVQSSHIWSVFFHLLGSGDSPV